MGILPCFREKPGPCVEVEMEKTLKREFFDEENDGRECRLLLKKHAV